MRILKPTVGELKLILRNFENNCIIKCKEGKLEIYDINQEFKYIIDLE